jgi:Ca2+-binding EF-hand superfamily protein
MASSRVIALAAGLIVSGAMVSPAHAQSKAEIQKMDRNDDGVVTRAEWQGENGAFRLHDTNKDGVLSGTEVWDSRQQQRARTRDGGFDDWSASAFTNLDRNKDNRITTNEWPFDRQSFRSADGNRDNILTRSEFLDGNNHPGRRDARDRFREFDRNNDGVIARDEWGGNAVGFRAMDDNRDGRISRGEFRDVVGTSGRAEESNAYRAGFERGQAEGRAAGREDRDRNQGYDLEGQRELESADSGYNARFGSKTEYQQGYRDGFRAAYPDGWQRR